MGGVTPPPPITTALFSMQLIRRGRILFTFYSAIFRRQEYREFYEGPSPRPQASVVSPPPFGSGGGGGGHTLLPERGLGDGQTLWCADAIKYFAVLFCENQVKLLTKIYIKI